MSCNGCDQCEACEPSYVLDLPKERDEWHCELFGTGPSLTFHPEKGRAPNWFWRWMQYLCFGNKWVKKEVA
jgi:hypothetical protein